jgi:prophage regulatory protein
MVAARRRPLSNAAVCPRAPQFGCLCRREPHARPTQNKLLLRANCGPPILLLGGFTNRQRMEECPVADAERIIRIKTVLARTGLSRSTLYRKIAEGTFPRQVPISVNGAGWHESAVNRWISNPAGYRAEYAERRS